MGSAFLVLSGCAGAGAVTALKAAAPFALAAGQQFAAGGDKHSEDEEHQSDDDTEVKCEQLVRHQPGIEEFQLIGQGIRSREIRLEPEGESHRWIVHRSGGNSTEGWRKQNQLARLHFDPPLRQFLKNAKPSYLAYVVDIPETLEENEQLISMVDDFGSKAGIFEWNNVRYSYSIVQRLPCFPFPEER